MKLFELIKQTAWLQVEIELLRFYPDEEVQISLYEIVFEKLKFISPLSSAMKIIIKKTKDDGYTYFDISGKTKGYIDRDMGCNLSYALEFTPWHEWLGMDISKKTFKKFSPSEILAHCLYEMTFIEFDKESIQSSMNEIENIRKDYFRNKEEE